MRLSCSDLVASGEIYTKSGKKIKEEMRREPVMNLCTR